MKLLLVSLALCWSSMLAFASPLPAQPHVYVEGAAEVEVEPDMMTFTLSLQKVDMDLATAKADVDKRSRLLIDTCKKFGIKAEEVATTALSIRPEYDYKDQQRVLTGNNVSRQVDITLRDLKKYPDMMRAMVDAQVSETISTSLSLSNKTEVENRAQIAAMGDAKARAERLAKSQGKKLGEPYSISEFHHRQVESWELRPSRQIAGESSPSMAKTEMRMADGGEPFAPGVMKLKAEVFVVYLLQ